MNKSLLMVPAILLAGLAVSPAYAVPVTSLKEVVVGSTRGVELTNRGNLALKVVTRTGYDRSNEANPSDNGIEEFIVEPGKSVVVNGPYQVYDYYPTRSNADSLMYVGS